MKFQIFLLLSFLLFDVSYADNVWYSFRNKKNELIGFKDSKNKVKIKPKFIFTPAKEFHNIIAVIEDTGNNKFKSYFLLKNGIKVGLNSHYIWDNSPDCESDGTIRFRNKKKGVGFFDRKGKVLIPAIYSDATPFRNGMAIVLKNAKKMCFNGKPYSLKNRCEHWKWEGGKTYLIDKQNKILVENFWYVTDLNWLSVKISDKLMKDRIWDSFLGTDGKYYSFINYEKEFNIWIESFLKSTDIKSLNDRSISELSVWSKKNSEWLYLKTEPFLKKHNSLIIQNLDLFKKGKYQILKDSLNPYILDSKHYSKHFDSCGNSLNWKYPVYTVLFQNEYKNSFDFLRTDKGYKLISLNLEGIKY